MVTMVSLMEQPVTPSQRSQTLRMKASLWSSGRPTGTERTTIEDVLGSPAVQANPFFMTTQEISVAEASSPKDS